LKLLLDNNLPPRVAHCLQALFEREHVIRALRDWMAANTSDVEWIKALDQEGGWAVLTRDLIIRTRPHERDALDRSRIVYFFLAGQWLLPCGPVAPHGRRRDRKPAHPLGAEDGDAAVAGRARAIRAADQRRLAPATAAMTTLVLRRANVSRISGQWQHEDFDVFDGERDVGRIFQQADGAWFWDAGIGGATCLP